MLASYQHPLFPACLAFHGDYLSPCILVLREPLDNEETILFGFDKL